MAKRKQETFTPLPMPERPDLPGTEDTAALLVSYVYYDNWNKYREVGVGYRNWMLDSGAYTAWTKGKTIDLEQYTQFAKELLEKDPTLVEVMALDVIGDWQASLRNCEYMHRHGVAAIPTFHVGSPQEALDECARYEKFALGGAVGYPDKQRWAEQCFSRVWPHKIHGLGWGGENLLKGIPWHSADSSNWGLCSTAFGNWKSMPGGSVRGRVDLTPEVEWYLRLEKRVRARWKRVHEKHNTSFTLRLADVGSCHKTPWTPHVKAQLRKPGEPTQREKKRRAQEAAAQEETTL